MKCLEKDRARRYETASALALDVDRFLRDEPVSAGPPSSAYRLRKALRRYRGPFSAAAAFLLILLGGTVVSTVFWQRAERQATRAQEVKRILERFISFPQPMLSMLHAGAATKTFGPDVQLIKVVDEAARSLEVTPAGQPEIEADVRFALGKSYFGLSRVSESEKQLEGAWVLYHRLFGDDDRRTIECLNMLGTAQFWAGDYDAGVSSIRTAISGFVRHIGPRDEVTLGAKLVLAIYVVHRPDGFAEAERLAREVLDARRAKQPQALRDVSMAQAVLAFVLCGAGKADEARPMANEAVEQITRSPERTDADEFFCRHVLGNCELGRDRLEEAEQQYRLAIGAGDRVAGSDSLMCAITRGQLGSCLIAQKRFDEAEPILRKSLDTRQRSVGPTHPYTVVCVCDLASARFALGRTSEAEMELRQCLEECVRRDGPDHPNTRMAVERVTQTLGTVGRPEQEVNELLRRLLEEADGPNRR